jgi:dTDP-4-amino-4,6-dideoxygalactose transaminase
MNVPFFDYTELYKTDYPIYKESLMSVIERADFILRSDLEDFEENMAKFMGVKHCVGVANGTDAIWLGLRAAGVGPGDEVIVPAHTYIATADAVWAVGATPVVVDIADDHMISVDAAEAAITPRTNGIIAVNLNGRAARLDLLLELCKKRQIQLFEDNAQGLGATIGGKAAGTYGVFSSLSFYPAKILGGLGDGGGVVTNSAEIMKKIKLLRSHGRDEANLVVEWGFNSRLDNLQAAVLDSKLRVLNENIANRRRVAEVYFEALSEIEELQLPQQVAGTHEHFDSYQNYEIEAKDRDGLKEYLSSNGVGTLIQWGGKGIHQFGLDGIRCEDVGNANRIISQMLMLPMSQYLSEEQVRFVATQVKNFYSAK